MRLAMVEGWDRDNPGCVELALERGQAVFLEKPGARDLAAARQLAAKLRARPVPFQMAYMLCHSPAIAEARRIIEADLLGHVTLARFHIPGPGGRHARARAQPARR